MVKPTQPNRAYGAAVNPLRRVPALETDDGEIFIDSRVIVEFLNHAAKGSLVPKGAAARIACFNRHAVVTGATEGLVSAMYEMKLRPEERRWPDWAADQVDKAHAALDWVEANLADFRCDFDLGEIALVCLASYAQFRFAHEDWLGPRPLLAAYLHEMGRRESVATTAPRE